MVTVDFGILARYNTFDSRNEYLRILKNLFVSSTTIVKINRKTRYIELFEF